MSKTKKLEYMRASRPIHRYCYRRSHVLCWGRPSQSMNSEAWGARGRFRSPQRHGAEFRNSSPRKSRALTTKPATGVFVILSQLAQAGREKTQYPGLSTQGWFTVGIELDRGYSTIFEFGTRLSIAPSVPLLLCTLYPFDPNCVDQGQTT